VLKEALYRYLKSAIHGKQTTAWKSRNGKYGRRHQKLLQALNIGSSCGRRRGVMARVRVKKVSTLFRRSRGSYHGAWRAAISARGSFGMSSTSRQHQGIIKQTYLPCASWRNHHSSHNAFVIA
jgi:hypothetical protein